MKNTLYALAALFAFAGLARAEDRPLSHEEVSGGVNAHMDDLKACIKEHGAGKGRLVVDFVIQPDGTTKDSKVKQSSSNSPLDKCIAGKFAHWKFPKPRGGVYMAVDYPFDFTPPVKHADLSEDQVRSTLKAHQPDIVNCYNEALTKKNDLGAGTIHVDFEVTPAGNVVATGLKDSTFKFPQLETCIVTKTKAWQFPKVEGEGNMKFSLPFILTPPPKKDKDKDKKSDKDDGE